MSYNIDFSLATSVQIERALCKRLEKIRLSRNTTQAHIAEEAGVSLRTMGRLENGKGVSLDTFIRVMAALRVQDNLQTLLPDPSVRPVERVGANAWERKRARPVTEKSEKSQWVWGDSQKNND